jgi:hypothetical protein
MSDSESKPPRPRKLEDIFADQREASTAFFDRLMAPGWELPPDPFVPEDWKMADPDDQREARADALHEAVMLHGEFENQEAFRGEEVEAVIETAKRFYDYIWEGR